MVGTGDECRRFAPTAPRNRASALADTDSDFLVDRVGMSSDEDTRGNLNTLLQRDCGSVGSEGVRVVNAAALLRNVSCRSHSH